ncbi:MAG TPA: acyl carrier protein [Erysipelotrichaceae bacterium]|nr:acyl carrier protein [Erysipelotrichaceae bacterium]
MNMLEELKKIVISIDPEINLENVKLETRLIEDLHFDSLGIMMFAMSIEDTFGVSFDEPMNFLTVKDVVDYLENHQKLQTKQSV